MSAFRAIEICVEQARREFDRAKEAREKRGPTHQATLYYADRGAMAYQCASKIAEEFGLPEPEVGDLRT
jgi:hypothetical protein